MSQRTLMTFILSFLLLWSGTSSSQEKCASIFSEKLTWASTLHPSANIDLRHYSFLVHAVRNENLLLSLTDGRYLPASVPHLFTSLISERNNQTIWNSPGVILKANEKNIVYASLSDTRGAVCNILQKRFGADELRRAYQVIGQQIGIKKIEEVISQTSTESSPYNGYSEILLKNEEVDGERPEIFGFFYFVDAQGQPILSSKSQVEIYKRMLSLSDQYQLPMIALKPTSQKLLSSFYNKTESLLNYFNFSVLSSH